MRGWKYNKRERRARRPETERHLVVEASLVPALFARVKDSGCARLKGVSRGPDVVAKGRGSSSAPPSSAGYEIRQRARSVPVSQPT